jgi:hypothetical protein
VASLRYEICIDAPADTVFDIVGKADSIQEWFPGITASSVDGTTRIITTASGIEMPEEILCNDPLQRRFAYRITAPFYKFHLGSIDVIALDDAHSLCIYTTTALPDTLCLIVAGGCFGALKEIKRIAESKVGN